MKQETVYEITARGSGKTHEWTVWYIESGEVIDQDRMVITCADAARMMRSDFRRWGIVSSMRYYSTTDLELRYAAGALL